jgi:glycosyl transferase, family 25
MKTYIIHVSDAYVREKHMQQQLAKFTCNAEWVVEGDMKDLDADILQQYFSDELKSISPATSCAYKHILAYNKLLSTNEPYALILEDDIFLGTNVEALLQTIVEELSRDKLKNVLISLEDSNLRYVKGSQRKSGQYLYPEKKGRMAGAYLIDREAAEALLSLMQRQKCHLPIDWFHNFAAENGAIQIYWAHPTCATQGSLNGRLPTSIDDKTSGRWRRISFSMQRIYKKYLWKLR